MPKHWIIRLRFVKAVDEKGNNLPYRSRVKKEFDNFVDYQIHINNILRYVKRKYGKTTTIDVIKTVKCFRTRGELK